MTITPADVVRACFQAYEDKDRNAIENLLADDFHFTSPYDNRIDRRTYFERCWPHCEQMASFSIQRLLMDGDHVWVIYELQMKDARRFRNAELHTVRNAKVTDVEVYFGGRSLTRLRQADFCRRPANGLRARTRNSRRREPQRRDAGLRGTSPLCGRRAVAAVVSPVTTRDGDAYMEGHVAYLSRAAHDTQAEVWEIPPVFAEGRSTNGPPARSRHLLEPRGRRKARACDPVLQAAAMSRLLVAGEDEDRSIWH